MSVPTDRRYLESHEWFQPQGDLVIIGITQSAADDLTDITFVSLPKVGDTIEAGKPFGEIESVKATSDLYSGIDGQVVEINEQLANEPALVNTDPFAAGWMIKVKPTTPGQVETLLSAADYTAKSGH